MNRGMSRKLNIDTNSHIWAHTIFSILRGEVAVCPYCSGKSLEVNPVDLGDRIGYLTITCPACNKTGYFSRVKFPEGLEVSRV